jgi:hypothetical protein
MNVLFLNRSGLNAPTISRIGRNVTDNAAQFAANYGECCSSVSAHPGGDHEIATGLPPRPLMLAGSATREEDRPLQKK